MTAQIKNASEQECLKEDSKHLNTLAAQAYTDQKKQSINEEQIVGFLPMVHKIARRVISYLKPPLSFEDLVSAGTVGLVKAARDFDPSRQADFKTYAYIRVKGEILDELRRWSFRPTNLNRWVHRALELAGQIASERGTIATDTELAKQLGVSMDKLYEIYESFRAQHFVSMDGFEQDVPGLSTILPAANVVTPDKQLEQSELKDKLAEAIQQLPKRHRQIILLYYQQNLTMKQIAQLFKITESRVSQLHACALFHLSVKMRRWKDGR